MAVRNSVNGQRSFMAELAMAAAIREARHAEFERITANAPAANLLQCQVLRSLCRMVAEGKLEQLVSEMVDSGECEDGREWLRSVLEVRA